MSGTEQASILEAIGGIKNEISGPRGLTTSLTKVEQRLDRIEDRVGGIERTVGGFKAHCESLHAPMIRRLDAIESGADVTTEGITISRSGITGKGRVGVMVAALVAALVGVSFLIVAGRAALTTAITTSVREAVTAHIGTP